MTEPRLLACSPLLHKGLVLAVGSSLLAGKGHAKHSATVAVVVSATGRATTRPEQVFPRLLNAGGTHGEATAPKCVRRQHSSISCGDHLTLDSLARGGEPHGAVVWKGPSTVLPTMKCMHRALAFPREEVKASR